MIIAVFVGLLCLPGITALTGFGNDADIAAREQRRVGPLPDLPDDLAALRAFPKGLEAWFDDRFGLREQMILLHNGAKALLGISPNDRAIIGKDGWLFIDQTRLMDANRGAWPFPDGAPQRLAARFVSLQEGLAARGIAYVQYTPPDKQSLYADLLPSRIEFVGPSRYQQWRDAARASALHFADLYPALEDSRRRGESPYMQTDSHWNCRGAYLAYREVMTVLNRQLEHPLPVVPESAVRFRRFHDPIGRDLARNFIGVPVLFPEHHAMDCSVGDEPRHSYYSVETGKPVTRWALNVAARPSRVVNHDLPDGPRALVLRDSFTNAMIDFLNHSFGEVIYMRHYADLPDAALIDEIQPDVVLYGHVERSLGRLDVDGPADLAPVRTPDPGRG